VTGLLELGAALWLRSLLKDEWPLLLVGAVSLVLGLILLFRPAASALAVLWLFGAYAIIFAFRLRSLIEVRQEV
jgi:uncharacterized membrane protein HdeD (DUF308 family)